MIRKLQYSRIASLVLVLVALNASQAQQYGLTWFTFPGGGGTSAGGDFQMTGTASQLESGERMTGGPFAVTGGFQTVSLICTCPGDLNHDGKKDGRDIQKFVACIIDSPGGCSCADLDIANGVNLADVPVFVNNLIAGASCP